MLTFCVLGELEVLGGWWSDWGERALVVQTWPNRSNNYERAYFLARLPKRGSRASYEGREPAFEREWFPISLRYIN